MQAREKRGHCRKRTHRRNRQELSAEKMHSVQSMRVQRSKRLELHILLELRTQEKHGSEETAIREETSKRRNFRIARLVIVLTGRQKGGFVKGWFWRMCPRSGFRSQGTCERTLVPVFVPGEHPNVPSFRFSVRGHIRQNHPFVNPRSSV